MSYKIEVYTAVVGAWTGNALRFETYAEAQSYGIDLLSRWFVPESYRVVESDEDPTHLWIPGSGLEPIAKVKLPDDGSYPFRYDRMAEAMTHKGVVPSHEILSALRSRPRPAVICSSCRSVLVVGTLPAVGQ